MVFTQVARGAVIVAAIDADHIKKLNPFNWKTITDEFLQVMWKALYEDLYWTPLRTCLSVLLLGYIAGHDQRRENQKSL